MADFVLDHTTNGVLGGGQFKTVPFEMTGTFREVQFHLTQSTNNGDAEPHFFEFHFTIEGVSMEDL